MFLHVTDASYLEDYKVEVAFNNGRKGIADLTDAWQKEGQHNLQFDGSALKQGVYFCEFQTLNSNFNISKNSILIIAR